MSHCDILFLYYKGVDSMTIKEMRTATGMSQAKFSAYFGVPTHTLQCWEQGVRKPPAYVAAMMERILRLEKRV